MTLGQDLEKEKEFATWVSQDGLHAKATACTMKVKSAQGTGRSSMYLDHNALGGK